MSDNKMGGVPSETRDALYKLFDVQSYRSDASDTQWAKAIRKLTELGPKKALELMEK